MGRRGVEASLILSGDGIRQNNGCKNQGGPGSSQGAVRSSKEQPGNSKDQPSSMETVDSNVIYSDDARTVCDRK